MASRRTSNLRSAVRCLFEASHALMRTAPTSASGHTRKNSAFERASTCPPKADLTVTIVYEFTHRIVDPVRGALQKPLLTGGLRNHLGHKCGRHAPLFL